LPLWLQTLPVDSQQQVVAEIVRLINEERHEAELPFVRTLVKERSCYSVSQLASLADRQRCVLRFYFSFFLFQIPFRFLQTFLEGAFALAERLANCGSALLQTTKR